MKNRKSILLLLFALALATAAHVWLGRTERLSTHIVRRAPLLNAMTTPRALVFTRPDRPTVRLVRTDQWRLTEPFAAPADEQAVLRLVDALTQTELVDALTDAEMLALGRSRSDYRLDAPVLSVSVEAEKPVRIDFGSATPATNGVFAGVAGGDSVGIFPSAAYGLVDVPADALRRRTLFPVDVDAVQSYTVKSASGGVCSFRRSEDQWQSDGKPVAGAQVRAFLSALLSAEAADFVWPVGTTNEAPTATVALLATYGLDPESAATVTLSCADGVNRQMSFGLDTPDGRVYALVQNGEAIVTVDARLRERLIQTGSKASDTRLFPCEAGGVMSFSLTDGDTVYALARTGDSGWRLDTPVVAPADGATVRALLDRLLALSANDKAGDADPAGVRVSLMTNAEPVVVSRAAAFGELRLEDLRAKEILRIDPVVVRRLVRTTADPAEKPSAVLYARDRNCWAVESGAFRAGTVRAEGVREVLAALFPLRASRIERLRVSPADLAGYGLEKPFLTLAVDREGTDSVRRNILIGDKVDKSGKSGARYATVGSSDAVFVLSADDVRRLTAEIVAE